VIHFSQTKIASDLYNQRYEELGKQIQVVGWGSRESQHLRFEVLLRGLSLVSKSFIDVGSGLGDLVTYVHRQVGNDFSYIGIDVAEKLVEAAALSTPHEESKFYHGDIFTLPLPQVDYVISSGTFSLQAQDGSDCARASLMRMFDLCNEAVSVNFLSTRVDFMSPKNLHFSPEVVLGWALDITPNVILYSDYPLYEFTVQLFR
jgi:SAM-dependent methyltransferase